MFWGGNEKVVLGKWLAAHFQVLAIGDPSLCPAPAPSSLPTDPSKPLELLFSLLHYQHTLFSPRTEFSVLNVKLLLLIVT